MVAVANYTILFKATAIVAILILASVFIRKAMRPVTAVPPFLGLALKVRLGLGGLTSKWCLAFGVPKGLNSNRNCNRNSNRNSSKNSNSSNSKSNNNSNNVPILLKSGSKNGSQMAPNWEPKVLLENPKMLLENPKTL